MAIENKVTRLYPEAGQAMTEEVVQAHIDAMNAQGYYLVAVDNISGWYRFFWAKEVQS